MPERDFSQRDYFPGTSGNRFDVILHGAVLIQKIPAGLFAAGLYLLAFLASRFQWIDALGLWGFFILDWVLLASLPWAGKSYGPSKPPVIVLALLRCIFGTFPIYFSLPAQCIGVILVIYAFWIEPHHIILTHQVLNHDEANTWKTNKSAAPG